VEPFTRSIALASKDLERAAPYGGTEQSAVSQSGVAQSFETSPNLFLQQRIGDEHHDAFLQLAVLPFSIAFERARPDRSCSAAGGR
jgi:hypothetical protein